LSGRSFRIGSKSGVLLLGAKIIGVEEVLCCEQLRLILITAAFILPLAV
jgi:hypothetical protein